jgi:formylglycine-generating enzyme required for sulfatase activity
MKFFLLLLICFFSIPIFAQKKGTKNFTVLGPDSIIYDNGFIAMDSLTKGGIRVPLELQKEHEIEGFTFIQPVDLVYRNIRDEKRLFFSTSWIYRFPERILRNLIQNYKVYIDDLNALDYTPLFAPFYFKNDEVTNAEYREFVHWVRDSMARRLLAEHFPDEFLLTEKLKDGSGLKRLNWEKDFRYTDEEYMPLLRDLYLPDEARYSRRKEFNVNAFFYCFGHNAEPLLVEVYPDTTVWKKNPFSGYSEFQKLYFWHPAFDDFPVVGVSVPQIKGFLDWKQKQMEISLRKEYKKNVSVELLLPDDHEFECAQLFLRKKAATDWTHIFLFSEMEANSILQFSDVIPLEILVSMHDNHNSYLEFMHTSFSPYFNYPMHMRAYSFPSSTRNSENNISGLTEHSIYGNVSEWTRSRFEGMRMEIYLFYERFQESVSRKYEHIPHTKGVRRKFQKGDMLVLGANMLDLRNRLDGPHMPQSYAHPDSTFATVGFRYVIRIKED